MTPNTGYEVTCDDSLLSLEPVPSNGLGIMEFAVDPRATGSPTKICVRVPAPPVIFGEEVGALMDTSVIVAWQTDRPSRSRVEYGQTTAYGSTTPMSEKLVLLHVFTLEDLEPSTVYHYRLRSTDAFGNETTSGDLTFETLPERPRILGFAVSALTDTTITLSWTTSALCEARVDYGEEHSHEHSTPTISGFAVKHEVTVEGLEPATEYVLAAVGTDELGRVVRSDDIMQATDIPDLRVLSPTVVDTTMTTAVISWRTTTASRASVDYGPTDEYGWTIDTGPQNATEHLAVIEGLTAGATYHYRIRANDEYGQSVETNDAVFETKPEGSPEVLTIHKLAVDGVGPGRVAVAWVTNLPATSTISWGLTQDYTDSMVDSMLVTKHALVVDGLLPAMDYHASVSSITEEGTEATFGDFVFTSPPPDLAITRVQVDSVGSTSITVSWTTNEAATAWLEYGLTPECGSATAPSEFPGTEHTASVAELGNLTTYYVRAAAAVGGYVVRSTPIPVTTAPPELAVLDVALSDTAATSATVRWSTTNPSFSYVRYGETEAYGLATAANTDPATAQEAVVEGLSPDTEYHLQVVSIDTFGQSAMSEDLRFVTSSLGPLLFRDVSVYDIGPSFASVSWQTSHRARGVLRYGLTPDYTDSIAVSELAIDHAVIVTGLASGTTYHMSIRAINEEGTTRVSSDVQFETHEYQDLAPPHAPTELAAATDDDAVVLSWAANSEHDLAGYRVYRRSEMDTTVALLDVAPTYRTSYRDEDVVAGTVYEYAVSAFDGSGNISERSEWMMVAAGVGPGGRLWSWPNPLVDRTTIRLALPATALQRGGSHYAIRIYDTSGRLVRTLSAGSTSDATVTTTWNGRDEQNYPVSSGVYFCVAEFAGGGTRSKLVVLR
jgi:hypothetical protein